MRLWQLSQVGSLRKPRARLLVDPAIKWVLVRWCFQYASVPFESSLHDTPSLLPIYQSCLQMSIRLVLLSSPSRKYVESSNKPVNKMSQEIIETKQYTLQNMIVRTPCFIKLRNSQHASDMELTLPIEGSSGSTCGGFHNTKCFWPAGAPSSVITSIS